MANRYELPRGLTERLRTLRRAVRRQKVVEAAGAAVAWLAFVYLFVFVLERLGETPAWLRGALFATALVVVLAIIGGLAVRWYWGLRRPEQIARLVGRTFPSLGDQILGVIELADGRTGYAAPRLIEAALAQADQRTERFDFQKARPPKRSRRAWLVCAAFPLLVVALALAVPDAAMNTWQRWALAWQPIPRYTFVRIASLPDEVVVPYAEPMQLSVSVEKDSKWIPARARARYVRRKLEAEAESAGKYAFSIEKPTQEASVRIAVGDARETVEVRPLHRPELEAVEAEIRLPEYLRRRQTLNQDVRTGRFSVVVGSRVAIRARANRALRRAEAAGAQVEVEKNEIHSEPIPVDKPRSVVLAWQDVFGLEGKSAFELAIEPQEDELPVVSWSGLHSGQVVLLDETVTFDVVAQDDFGVREIRMQWQSMNEESNVEEDEPASKVLAVGSPESQELATVGTFQAKELGVEPGIVWLRIVVIDYCPDHEPVYSGVISLQVMTPDQHALWLNQQLRKWYARAEDVYKREEALHEVNRRLRSLSPAQLDRPETRQEIERQAAAEEANAARLNAVTKMGRDLLQEASKNKEIGVGHLETLAENLLKLEELAEKRMPSVADLLQKAASAKQGQQSEGSASEPEPQKSSQDKTSDPMRGSENGADSNSQEKSGSQKPSDSEELAKRGSSSSSPSESSSKKASSSGDQASESKKGVPPVNTSDLTYYKKSEADEQKPPSANRSSGGLGLPQNILQGGPKPKGQASQQRGACPAGEKLDEAVQEQEKLLEEFAQVRDALRKLLINMEGSTFVKRLKAASKRQFEIAGELERFAVSAFGAEESSFGLESTEEEDDDESGEVDVSSFGAEAGAENEEEAADEPKDGEDAMQPQVSPEQRATFMRLAAREQVESDVMRKLQSDLLAYYDRVQMAKIKPVLDEMEDADPPRALRGLGQELQELRAGDVMAEAEYWGETFDRWAEMLVDVASGGT